MKVASLLLPILALFAAPECSRAQDRSGSDTQSLRVAIAGLVHGHAEGFLEQYGHRADIQIVGIAEPDMQLFSQYAARFGLEPGLHFASLDELIQKTHPQAVLAYTNTYEHRRVVEICARYGIAVMMEKPLATTVEDAHAIADAAHRGKIHVLVNYETTWYRSNRAAYSLVREKAIGGVRKIVVHDGHQGPKEIGVGPEFLAWLSDPKLNGGGALFDFGCYGADLATWLMEGRRPLTVTAITQHFKPNVYPRVDDDATIVLTYPRAQAILQASWNWPFSRKDMEVYGETGYATTVGRDEIRVRRAKGLEELVTAAPLAPPQDDSLSYLRAVIAGQIQPEGLSSLETNLIVTEILDAARQSAATGKTIRLVGKN